MNDVQKAAFSIGVIPVIAIDDAEKAVPLARALLAGGLPAAEVTFRTAAGEEAIRRIAAEVPEVLVGAGTVLNLEQCDRALAAGAKMCIRDRMQGEAAQLLLEVDGLGAALGVGLAAGLVKLHALKAQVIDGAVHIVGADGDVAVGAAAGGLVALLSLIHI